MSTPVNLPDGDPAIVARPTANTAVAFSAKCTHMGCTVQPAGSELHCPCHGSKYNALTGAVIQGRSGALAAAQDRRCGAERRGRHNLTATGAGC
jgi:Rieske Fe-S protein